MRFDLTDAEWALLEPLLPRARKSARADDRRVMNGIFYIRVLVRLGAICQAVMGRTRPPTIGSPAGRDVVSVSACSMPSPRNHVTACI